MKLHLLRPLLAFLAVVALILVARAFFLPKDFGVNERGYRFGWHRAGNEQEWKDFTIKYKGSDLCMDCHNDKFTAIKASPHKDIQCENCHGPAGDHPADPPKLVVDKSRDLCLRCHAPLPYASSARSQIKSMIPDLDSPDTACVTCHNPHTTMEAGK
jgi:predicted CXXCH cytochrome family protein